MLCTAYDLRIDVDPVLPGFLPCDEPRTPDITIRIQSTCDTRGALRQDSHICYRSQWLSPDTGEPELVIYRSPATGAYRFEYSEGLSFDLSAAADRIVGRIPPFMTLADAATFVGGPILGCALRRRRILSLHASAIEVGDRAITLVGPSGAGKSTTAAMFALLGCKVISEDVAALLPAPGGFTIPRGPSDLALRPDAVALLYGDADRLERFSDTWDKHRLDLQGAGAFASRSRPLGAVYLLNKRDGGADAPLLGPLRPRDAMVQLLGNVYGNGVFHDDLCQQELDVVQQIVRTVPVRLATAGTDGRDLGRFCETIIADCRLQTAN
jgi:hypothetical protein